MAKVTYMFEISAEELNVLLLALSEHLGLAAILGDRHSIFTDVPMELFRRLAELAGSRAPAPAAVPPSGNSAAGVTDSRPGVPVKSGQSAVPMEPACAREGTAPLNTAAVIPSADPDVHTVRILPLVVAKLGEGKKEHLMVQWKGYPHPRRSVDQITIKAYCWLHTLWNDLIDAYSKKEPITIQLKENKGFLNIVGVWRP